MDTSDLLAAAVAPAAPVAATDSDTAAAPRTVLRYFIAQRAHLRTGQALPGARPFVYTREFLNLRPVSALQIVNGHGWCIVAEITSAEWLRVTLAQKAHDDAQGDGGQPAVLVPVVPQLPPSGSSVVPSGHVAAPKARKLSGIAARVAAGMQS